VSVRVERSRDFGSESADVGQASGRHGFELLARGGFIARGVVYGIIGILALKLAFGAGGKTTDQKGALETVAQQPFGRVLLILVAIGLGGYALWRFVRAALGHGVEASDDSGFDRVAALASGVVYAGLCAIAVSILVGSSQTSSTSGSGSSQKAAGGVLGWPGGQWLVGLAGGVLIGVAAYQGYRGMTRDFLKDSKTEEMSARVREFVEWIGVVGHGARMIVFGLVGVFLIKAAVEYNPSAAVGLDGALQKLANQPYGSVLLGVVAAGLVAFALYSLSDARYRRI
jgi:Domain of Unknown Function (DUF1206)